VFSGGISSVGHSDAWLPFSQHPVHSFPHCSWYHSQASEIPGGMAGGGDFRPASGDGGVGGVDYRNEKTLCPGSFFFRQY